MTSAADRTIFALRATHDQLAAVVSDLSDEQLTTRSGASEWTVAQVLSHLGSGAEIALATLRVVIADAVSLTTSAPQATSTFIGPLETAMRLLAGRLTTRYTPAEVTMTGDLTLDDLRRVFPGY